MHSAGARGPFALPSVHSADARSSQVLALEPHTEVLRCRNWLSTAQRFRTVTALQPPTAALSLTGVPHLSSVAACMSSSGTARSAAYAACASAAASTAMPTCIHSTVPARQASPAARHGSAARPP